MTMVPGETLSWNGTTSRADAPVPARNTKPIAAAANAARRPMAQTLLPDMPEGETRKERLRFRPSDHGIPRHHPVRRIRSRWVRGTVDHAGMEPLHGAAGGGEKQEGHKGMDERRQT